MTFFSTITINYRLIINIVKLFFNKNVILKISSSLYQPYTISKSLSMERITSKDSKIALGTVGANYWNNWAFHKILKFFLYSQKILFYINKTMEHVKTNKRVTN